MRQALLIAALLGSTSALAYNESTGAGAGLNRFSALNYGPCAGVASIAGVDLGACIMGAYAAASAAGGGLVTVPPGDYPGDKTPIVFSQSYIGLECLPSGNPRDAASQFRGATRIIADPTLTGTMLTYAPPAGATSYLYGMSIKGCVFNANGAAAQAEYFQDIAYSGEPFEIRCAEALIACATLSAVDLGTGGGGGQGPGNQGHRITVAFKQQSNPGTGFLVRRSNPLGTDILYNNSYFDIGYILGYINQGDGFVASGIDNVNIGTMQIFTPFGGAGKLCVMAAPGYVTPTGYTTIGTAGAIHVNHLGNPCLVGGWKMQFAPVAASTNTGSASPATLSFTTAGATMAQGTYAVNLATTPAGVAPDASVQCTDGATTSRNSVLPGDPVLSVGATSIVLAQPISQQIAAGATCLVSSNPRGNAVVGTYTVTYRAATQTWDIAAPSGGHSQTGIAAVAGAVSFSDLIWMVSGTPGDGDSWSYTLAQAPRAIELDGVDTAVNGVQSGVFQYGASGWARARGNFYPTQFGPNGPGTTMQSELSAMGTCAAGALTMRVAENRGGVLGALTIAPGQYKSLLLLATVKDISAGVARSFSYIGGGVFNSAGTVTPDPNSPPAWTLGSYTAAAAAAWPAPTIAGDSAHGTINLSWINNACVSGDVYQINVGAYFLGH